MTRARAGLWIAVLVLGLGGCAVKSYGRLAPLTEQEKAQLSCRQIDLEIARARSYRATVQAESDFTGRNTFDVVGMMAFGNADEKPKAVASADHRIRELIELRRRKGCPGWPPA
jgi:nitroreductase